MQALQAAMQLPPYHLPLLPYPCWRPCHLLHQQPLQQHPSWVLMQQQQQVLPQQQLPQLLPQRQ
jgi:hypothetical protein